MGNVFGDGINFDVCDSLDGPGWILWGFQITLINNLWTNKSKTEHSRMSAGTGYGYRTSYGKFAMAVGWNWYFTKICQLKHSRE